MGAFPLPYAPVIPAVPVILSGAKDLMRHTPNVILSGAKDLMEQVTALDPSLRSG